jgi:hypothetical protein
MKRLVKKQEEKIADTDAKGEAPKLHRRKKKHLGVTLKGAKRHRVVMHDGELVRALERDYKHATREYHATGEALKEAREAHEAHG